MSSQLGQRVITAVVLLLVLYLALSSPYPWLFTGLTLLFVAAGTWEWLRLTGLASALIAALLLSLLLAASHSTFAEQLNALTGPALGLTSVVWLALTAGLLWRGQFPLLSSYRWFYRVAALVLMAACWLALMAAYQQGLLFMVSIMALVWVADIAAYFSGKAFGRHKLAPAISPGKTWEGVAGGVLAVCILAALLTQVPALQTSFSSLLFARSPLLALVLLAMLVGISIVGDLFESHIKRQAGVKDSSGLLPGHGGVFDRIDALLPVLPLAMLIHRYCLGPS